MPASNAPLLRADNLININSIQFKTSNEDTERLLVKADDVSGARKKVVREFSEKVREAIQESAAERQNRAIAAEAEQMENWNKRYEGPVGTGFGAGTGTDIFGIGPGINMYTGMGSTSNYGVEYNAGNLINFGPGSEQEYEPQNSHSRSSDPLYNISSAAAPRTIRDRGADHQSAIGLAAGPRNSRGQGAALQYNINMATESRNSGEQSAGLQYNISQTALDQQFIRAQVTTDISNTGVEACSSRVHLGDTGLDYSALDTRHVTHRRPVPAAYSTTYEQIPLVQGYSVDISGEQCYYPPTNKQLVFRNPQFAPHPPPHF